MSGKKKLVIQLFIICLMLSSFYDSNLLSETKNEKIVIRESRVRTTENLVGALKGRKGKKTTFLSTSAVGYYGFHRDKELDDPKGYGAIEYACYLMARDCGIEMSECRLFEEGDRRHFMTRRFDRSNNGKKLHMQSLCALAHFDFNLAGAYSYEQAFLTIRQLGLPASAIEQQFRRMVFNIVIRNQDDHVKNIAFLMNKTGQWALSPAFDMTYSYNPMGPWTATHQMTMNGKRKDFSLDDFKTCAKAASMKRGQAATIIAQVQDTIAKWSEFAEAAGVPDEEREHIQENLLLKPF